MPLLMGYTDPANQGDISLLPAGQHAVSLLSVKVVESDDLNNPGKTVERFQFTFESLKPMGDGKPGIISLWTGMKYGHPKGLLTAFINAVFGRPLTQDEARRFDIEKLVGIKGYVLIAPYNKQDGSPSVKFSSWLHPEKRPRPEVAAFFMDGNSEDFAPPVGARQADDGTPDQIAPDSLSDPFAEHAEGDIPDPFEGEE